jgi:mycothiol system anti-sigma-R factor
LEQIGRIADERGRRLVEMASSEDKQLEQLAAEAQTADTVSISSVESTKTEVTTDRTVHTVIEKMDAFDFYSCEEAIKRLNEYLDSELDSAEKADVIKHLQICEPCLERFSFEKTLITIMRKKMCGSVAPLQLKQRLAALMKSDK